LKENKKTSGLKTNHINQMIIMAGQKILLATMYIIYGGRSGWRKHYYRFLAAARAEKQVVVQAATKLYTHRWRSF
jgi:hypothetical protein